MDATPKKQIFPVRPEEFDKAVGRVVPGIGPQIRKRFQEKGITIVKYKVPEPGDGPSLKDLLKKHRFKDLDQLIEERKFLEESVLRKEQKEEQALRELVVLMQQREQLLEEVRRNKEAYLQRNGLIKRKEEVEVDSVNRLQCLSISEPNPGNIQPVTEATTSKSHAATKDHPIQEKQKQIKRISVKSVKASKHKKVSHAKDSDKIKSHRRIRSRRTGKQLTSGA